MALKNGSRFAVSMADVFPHGCHLVPDSITEPQDYDERTGRRSPAVDRLTGKRVFQCRVMDMDPALEGRSRWPTFWTSGRAAADVTRTRC
jgi:hypothetical protein